MAPSPSLFFHPLVVVLTGNQITALTAGFTSSNTPLRPIILALLVAYTCAGLAKFSNYTHTTSYFGIMFGMIYAMRPLAFFDRLILRKWAFEDRHTIFPAKFAGKKKQKRNDEYDKGDPQQVDGVPVTAQATKDTLGSRFAFGQEVAGSGRMVGTPWEAKNVAPFSSSDPTYVPSRASIIRRKVLIISASLVIREIFMEVQMSIDPFYIAQSRVPFLTRLGEVSREELLVRLILGVGKWVYEYCMLQVLGVFSILLAFLKPDELHKLRPLYGSLSDAYSLRGFWGKFWHQNLRNNFEGPSRFITHNILHLPRGSLLARYSFIFFVFCLSGVLHVASDIGMNLPPNQSGALRFFCTNAFGIMLEDGVQELYRSLNGGKDSNRLWTKLVGYVWVVIFLSWSTACWQYPQMRMMKWEDRLFQYGTLRSLVSWTG